MDRVILHCDCNSFFASVELLFLPQYRDKPVAVCGSVDDRHGIVLAKNELAKRFGVATAETAWQAKRKCPDIVFVPPHHELYAQYSKKVNAIYDRYTDLVEPFSIDESFLDVTGTLHLFGGDAQALADRIRREVREEIGITISVGVSFNKIFAKLGSDYKKPDATTVISRKNYQSLLYPLPVGELIYVGKASRAALAALGIHTIGDLAGSDHRTVTGRLGKAGDMLWRYANGLDEEPVRPKGKQPRVKSVGNGQTFRRNLMGEGDIRAGITFLADSVAMRLRRANLACTGVQITIKDADLNSIQRQTQIAETRLSEDISRTAMELVRSSWDPRRPVRMLTVTAIGLCEPGAGEQLSLFSRPAPDQDRKEQLEKALYSIRDKFGKHAVGRGNLVNNDLGLSTLSMKQEGQEEELDAPPGWEE